MKKENWKTKQTSVEQEQEVIKIKANSIIT